MRLRWRRRSDGFIADPADAQRIGAAGRAVVEQRFGWERAAAAIRGRLCPGACLQILSQLRFTGLSMQHAGDTGPGLSVFFPAYNDSGTIASLVITALQTARELTSDFEIIIVNDGSADATAQIADELARTYPEVRVVHHAAQPRLRRRAAQRLRGRDPRTGVLHRRRRAGRSRGDGGALGRLPRRRRSRERLQDQPIRSVCTGS